MRMGVVRFGYSFLGIVRGFFRMYIFRFLMLEFRLALESLEFFFVLSRFSFFVFCRCIIVVSFLVMNFWKFCVLEF